MKELLRKQTLLTDAFGVEITAYKDMHFALVELNEMHETSEGEADGYKEIKGVTLSLDYEELDALIEVLQQASDQLKRADNIFAE